MKASGIALIITIALIWIVCLVTMSVFGIPFAVIGSLLVMAGLNGWNKAKGNAYLANRYDETKKQ